MSSSYFSTPNYKAEQGKIADLVDKLGHGVKEILVSKSWGPIVVAGESSSCRCCCQLLPPLA